MIDRVHTKYGDSFKGCADYLLHDKQAETRERIEWTETCNMATGNPDAAWRVMAATAMDQDRLKREAGIRPGGRPGKGPVLHMTLSWHQEEKKELTKEEMIRAARGAIRAVKLDDRQALLVCHNDEPQPHVHILINRVSPADGRLPRDYNDFRKLSRWAKKYEKERGKIYCDQRIINEKARDRGEYVKAENNKPRHLVEMQQAVNDNDAKQRLEEEHRKAAFAIKEQQRKQRQRHDKAWAELQRIHKERKTEIIERTQHTIAQEKMQLRKQYRPRWDSLYHEQQAELRAFEQDESRAIGRMKNALKSIDFRSLIGRPTNEDAGRARTIAEAFDLLSNSGARSQAIERRHNSQDAALEKQQKAREAEVTKMRTEQQQRQLAENRSRLNQQRNDLLLVQAMEDAKIKAAWLEKGRRMRDQFSQMKEAEKNSRLEAKQPEQNTAEASKLEDEPTTEHEKTANTSDLLPHEGSKQAAKQIDQYVDRFRRRQSEHSRDSASQTKHDDDRSR